MKQRIISGAMCAIVAAVILCLYNTLVLEAAMSILGTVAVYELLSANGFKEHKPFLFTGLVFAFAMAYVGSRGYIFPLICLFLVVTVILTLRYHSNISFEKVSFFIVSSLFVPCSFLCMILLRNEFKAAGLLYIIIAFGGAWFADTGAYFTGRFLGKHKLSPKISPKKTIEGLIGGVITNIALIDLVAFLFVKIGSNYGVAVEIDYLMLSILAVVIAFASVAGDLIASVIKRQIGIKDYGNLIPGHGGIMDRFDSILFTAPAVYIITRYLTITI